MNIVTLSATLPKLLVTKMQPNWELHGFCMSAKSLKNMVKDSIPIVAIPHTVAHI